MTIAIISVVATSAVAIAGYVFTYYTRIGDRAADRALASERNEHERSLARDQRRHDDLLEAYESVIGVALAMADYVESTFPFYESGPVAGRRQLPNEEQQSSARDRVATIGSDEVEGARMGTWAAFVTFQHAEGQLRNAGSDTAEARKELEAARVAYRASLGELKAATRKDLLG